MSMIVVCDGMGGLQEGDIASTAAVRGFASWFEQELPQLVQEKTIRSEPIFLSWHRMLERLHIQLDRCARQTGARWGTTVSALLMTQKTLFVGQIGDSRIYLDDSQQTLQLTKDQTLAARECEEGRLLPDERETHKKNNILLQCLGTGQMEPVFLCAERPSQGAVLLCSDGFYHALSLPILHQMLAGTQNREQLQQQLQELIAYGRRQGETDNMTAVILKWDDTADLECTEPEEETEFWARISGEAAPDKWNQIVGGIQ